MLDVRVSVFASRITGDGVSETNHKKKAVLVAVQLPNVSDVEHQGSMQELERLVTTLGFEVVAHLSQKRKSPEKARLSAKVRLKN